MKQLIKLLNITPHAFFDDCNETEYVELATFKDRCWIRLLPLSKKEKESSKNKNSRPSSITGAFLLSPNLASLRKLSEKLDCNYGFDLHRKMQDADRIIEPIGLSPSALTEEDFLNIKNDDLNCTVGTQEAFDNAVQKPENFVSSYEVAYDFADKSWCESDFEMIEMNYETLVSDCSNFLKYSPTLDIFDDYFFLKPPDGDLNNLNLWNRGRHEEYRNVYKLFNSIGCDHRKVEVTINKSSNNTRGYVPDPTKEGRKIEEPYEDHAKRFYKYFKASFCELNGIKNIKFRNWNYVHRRGIYCGTLGGVNLELGVQEKLSAYHYLNPRSPSQVEEIYDFWDIGGNGKYYLQDDREYEVYPNFREICH